MSIWRRTRTHSLIEHLGPVVRKCVVLERTDTKEVLSDHAEIISVAQPFLIAKGGGGGEHLDVLLLLMFGWKRKCPRNELVDDNVA